MKYLEFEDAKSSKFWQVEVKGKEMIVKYGKIGTEGQTTVKKLATSSEAQGAADKATLEKIKKGYKEKKK